jgi:hypothetical protein
MSEEYPNDLIMYGINELAESRKEIKRLQEENENIRATRQLAWDAARRLCRAVWEFHGNHTYQNREQLVQMARWLNRNINDAEAFFAKGGDK